MIRRSLRPLAALVVAFSLAGVPPLARAEGVRPEVGKPLQAASALIKQRKGREAMAEIAKAEAVPNRTAYENQVIAQMKAAAASSAGDADATIRANEALLESGKVSGREAVTLVQSVAVAYYNKKDYANAAKWTQRYFKDGGNDPAMRTMLLQSHYLQGDCAAVDRSVNENKASETELQMLQDCYRRKGDHAGYVKAMEALVVNYPKKEYWTILVTNVQKKPGFSDRLAADVYRLKLATGNLNSAADYMEFAQLALQQGVPAEAKSIMDKGYAAGVLGKGSEAARQQRLRDLIEKSFADSRAKREQDEKDALAAKEGGDLVKVGMNYIYEGKVDQGTKLVEQGLKKGQIRKPEDAKLRLGEAQLLAGRREAGVRTLREVKDTKDGAADIARLWVLHARA